MEKVEGKGGQGMAIRCSFKLEDVVLPGVARMEAALNLCEESMHILDQPPSHVW